MQISDSFIIQAPLKTVWNFLLDVERMSQCVPGIESIEAGGDQIYRGRLAIKVGPISAKFNGLVTLTEVDEPYKIRALIQGEDKTIASLVKADFVSILEEVDGGTRVGYEMEVNIRGRLGQFGSAVTMATAKKITAEFANNVRAELEH